MSTETKMVHPRKILLAALLLPGSGHVWLGEAQRGTVFLFFTVILAWASTKMMPETASFLGRHIGGVFIYGMSVLDAYKTAKSRWEVAKDETRSTVAP